MDQPLISDLRSRERHNQKFFCLFFSCIILFSCWYYSPLTSDISRSDSSRERIVKEANSLNSGSHIYKSLPSFSTSHIEIPLGSPKSLEILQNSHTNGPNAPSQSIHSHEDYVGIKKSKKSSKSSSKGSSKKSSGGSGGASGGSDDGEDKSYNGLTGGGSLEVRTDYKFGLMINPGYLDRKEAAKEREKNYFDEIKERGKRMDQEMKAIIDIRKKQMKEASIEFKKKMGMDEDAARAETENETETTAEANPNPEGSPQTTGTSTI